ncbi:MAG: fatty acid desaturase [Pseudobdellovibrionaceae bacterium]
MAFIPVQAPDFHFARRKELLSKHGSVLRTMAKPNPWTFSFVLLFVGIQYTAAYFFKDSSIGVLLISVFFFGAFLNHALSVLVHEAAHNLIFKSRTLNRLAALICDWAMITPSSMAFRKYHMIHHDRMGDFGFDADMPTHFEAKLVGNSSVRKILWVFLLSVSQGLRPSRFKHIQLVDKWFLANLISNSVIVMFAFQVIGLQGLSYLFLSTFVALGLHSLGGRWIAEHFVTRPGQETYSYYGPLNKIMFNIGFHAEHHDLMNIPWNQLPKLKALAPELYETLHSYKSYTALLIEFIRNPNLSLYSRMRREGVAQPVVSLKKSPENVSERSREPEIQM